MSKVECSNVFPKFSVGDIQVAKDTKSYIIETSKFMLGCDDTYFATYWKPKQVEKPKGLVFIRYVSYHSGPEGHTVNFQFSQSFGFRGNFYPHTGTSISYMYTL